jgi:plastocyanin
MKAGKFSVGRTALLLVGALVAVPTVSVAADTRTVTLKDTKFIPAHVNVAPGDTVVWKNEDQVGHTVTFDDGSFDSHPNCVQPLIGNAVNCMNPGETVQRSFDAEGEYQYRCKLHASNGRGMVGLVSVKAAVVTATTTTTTTTATAEPPTTVTTAATTTTTRKLATSSTLASTTTSTVPAETTTTVTPGESPAFDPGDGGGQDGAAAPAGSGGGGGGSGSGTVALIVAVLLGVAGGGGVLLWRLRPRSAQP